MRLDYPPNPITVFKAYNYERVCPPTLLSDPQDLPVHPSSPPYRLNLLATDGICLFAVRGLFIQQIKINRANGVNVYTCSSSEVTPPTVHNRIIHAHFPVKHGGSTILVSGGCERTQGRATLTLLPLPEHNLDQHVYKLPLNNVQKNSLSSLHSALPAFSIPSNLPAISAWGLDAHAPTGRIAISSNSKHILILQSRASHDNINNQTVDSLDNSNNSYQDVRIPETEHVPEDDHSSVTLTSPNNETEEFTEQDHDVENFQPQGPFLTQQHCDNIPCVAFSPCGTYLASVSIDSSLAITYVGEDKGLYGKIIAKMPNRDSDSHPETEEMSWGVHWLGKYVGRYASIFDPVWDEIEKQHWESFWYRRTEVQYPSGPLRRQEDIQKHSAINVARAKCVNANPITKDNQDDTSTQDNQNCSNLSFSHSKPLEHLYHDNYLIWVTEISIKICRLPEKVIKQWEKDSKQIGHLEVCSELTISLRSRNFFRDAPQFRDIKYIPKLQLIVISGFSEIGILFIRVVRNNAAPQLGINRVQNRNSEVYMFVERMIPQPSRNCFVGTAIIERAEDDERLRSHELWLLRSQGTIEGWDIGKPTDTGLTSAIFG